MSATAEARPKIVSLRDRQKVVTPDAPAETAPNQSAPVAPPKAKMSFGLTFIENAAPVVGAELVKRVSVANAGVVGLLFNNGVAIALDCENSAAIITKLKQLAITAHIADVRPFRATREMLDSLINSAGDNHQTSRAQHTNEQKLFFDIIEEAVAKGTSDIHLLIQPGVSIIQFRLDGSVKAHRHEDTLRLFKAVSAAYNSMTESQNGNFTPEVPQDANSQVTLSNGKRVRLRIATAPASSGSQEMPGNAKAMTMVVRVLGGVQAQEGRKLGLADLGYSKAHIEIMEEASRSASGMVLISGPTGSGKTTTLSVLLGMIDNSRKIYTVEDPIELHIPNAVQIPANNDKEELTFASISKALMRMDPDVVMLGEIRDDATAGNAVKLSLSGHLLLSTVHVSTALQIPQRLEGFGVDKKTLGITGLLHTLVFQNLAPKMCKCKLPLTRQHDEYGRLSKVFGRKTDHLFITNPDGCSACKETGVKGRTVIAEVVKIDDGGAEMISNGDIAQWAKYLRDNGWQSVREHAKQKVLEGVVDPFVAESIVGSFNFDRAEAFNYGKIEDIES